MAKIIVRYRGPIRELTSVAEETLDVAAVRDILAHIKTSYGAQAQKKAKTMLIAVDGESILLRKAFATKLKDGETVQFLPICGGG